MEWYMLLVNEMADDNAAIIAISKAESQTHPADASLVNVNYYYRVHWIWTIALDEYELRIVSYFIIFSLLQL